MKARQKKLKKERGISLLLTVFLLSLMLSISLGIFDIIYSELMLSGDIRASFFALYAADEIVEKTVYLDRVSRAICQNLSNDCWTTPLITASNNACNSVKVSKKTGTGYTEILGVGQYPGGSPCDTTSSFLSKRSFFFKYPMLEAENLAGWWRFDNESSQTVFDWTANDNDGVLGLSTSVETEDPIRQNTIPLVVFGGALQYFDTENDRVTFPNSSSINLNWPISITSWVCNKSAVNGYKTILKKGAGATEETYGFYLFQPVTGNFNLRFKFKDSAGTEFTTGSAAVGATTLNRWTHAAVTYDGSQVRFYINGIILGSPIPRGESLTQGNEPLRLGLNIDNLAQNFQGIMDEIKIFSKTLQDNEVLKEYNYKKPTGDPGDPAWQC
ncbi:MAG: hypothetical protein A3G49_02200 [Candidatus Sungbacteria bacterium RIFCSPLOWO2_12_FULL_41_11]|uniref:LamG-like jellyroll fold domain-containing protein n=1 Tax=Candidatus Sungbacteria bacterium RIFCSPLOWO2_12_FULL_41_11 TaxID=1802286 RepID=A0A1G2LNQ1_9BACT|nr:MAG: hypothetical protein A3G49_02200 [Candidatus Sungbacteria bacterium RIFCSPLOWO2_12_FULL_41_11]